MCNFIKCVCLCTFKGYTVSIMFEGLIEWIMSIITMILSWFGYEMKSADAEAKVELLPPVIPSAPVEMSTEVLA